MLHILYGPDDFSLRERLRQIRNALGNTDLLDLSTQQLDGATLTPDHFAGVCQAMPFMVSRRLVIVEGLLTRFAPKAGPAQSSPEKEPVQIVSSEPDAPGKAAAPPPESKKPWLPFVNAVKNIPESTVLVLIDGELRGKNPLLAELSPLAAPETFPRLQGDALFNWVQDRAAKYDARLSPEVINHVIDLLGNNLWLIDSEIQKLVLFSADKPVNLSDVEEVVSYAREANVFQLVDAILQRRLQRALGLLHRLQNEGAAATYILAMLAREIRRLLLAGLMSAGRTVPPELARELRLVDVRDLNIIKGKARRYSRATLEDLYHRMLQTDVAIKTGKNDPDMAIEMLIGRICEGTPPPPSVRRPAVV